MGGGVRVETWVAEIGTMLRISGADSRSQWRVPGVGEVTGIVPSGWGLEGVKGVVGVGGD